MYEKTDWDKSLRKCRRCGKEFRPTHPKNIYCSHTCLYKGQESFKPKAFSTITKIRESNYTNFNALRFWSEEEFEEWFRKNYVIFGLRELKKINRSFPDVIAETYSGKILRIELELCANNFVAHNHDPKMCDLIISFVKTFGRDEIKGVPVIAIFNAKGMEKGCAEYNPKSLELTDYFNVLVRVFEKNLSRFLKGNAHLSVHDIH